MKTMKLGLGVVLTALLFSFGTVTVATAPKAQALEGYHWGNYQECYNKNTNKPTDATWCIQGGNACSGPMGSLPECQGKPTFEWRTERKCFRNDGHNGPVDDSFCADEPSTGGSSTTGSATSDDPQTVVDECLSNHEISPSLTRAEKIENAVAVPGASVPAPTEAEAGSCASTWGITADKSGVSVPAEYNGHHITFFIYSEPKFLGATVVENGRFNVDLSSYSGAHRIVLVNDNAQVVGETVANFGGEAKIALTTGSSVAGVFSIALLTIISAAAALTVRKNNA